MVALQSALAALALGGAGQTVLLDFYADWCGPCRAMEPAVQGVIEKGYPVRKVNIDREPALAQQYAVQGVPCYVMLVDGREVDRVVGPTTFSRLERMCKLGLAQSRPQAPPMPAEGIAQSPPPTAPPPMAKAAPLAASPGGRVLPASTAADWRTTPLGSAPSEGSRRSVDDALLAAAVRVRIEDPKGHSCGSGTIIDVRGEEALILTCGHIFRESAGKGAIEVDLFAPTPAQRLPGRLLSYDLQRDVGLVAVKIPGQVIAARVAPPGFRIGQGEPVVSVGGNNGGPPTAIHSRVTSLDKYLGPPNIQVAGQPVEGRSGGGLFSEDGLLIGVCNAADPSDKEGLFAALGSIHAELDRAGLACVYQRTGPSQVAQAAPPPRSLVPVEGPSLPRQMPLAAAAPAPGPTAGVPLASAAAPHGLRPEEQATLDELRKRLHEGAEVICVVRSRKDPAARSEVILLDRVSPEFLKRLAAEAHAQGSPHLTSLEVPRSGATAGRSGSAGEVNAQSGRATPPQRSSIPPPAAGQRPAAGGFPFPLPLEWSAERPHAVGTRR